MGEKPLVVLLYYGKLTRIPPVYLTLEHKRVNEENLTLVLTKRLSRTLIIMSELS